MRSYTRYSQEIISYVNEIRHNHTYVEIAELVNQKFNVYLTRHGVDNILRKYKLRTNYNALSSKEGTIITRYNGSGVKYLYIKVNKKWILYSHYVWKQNFGELPNGYVILYRDRNTLNCNIDNLIAVNHSQAVAINRLKPITKEQMDLAIAITDLRYKIKSL